MAINTFIQNKSIEKYDGIITCISCHGSIKNTIRISTGNYMDIHELQNEYFCKNDIITNVPRVFFLDCCRAGNYDAERDDPFENEEVDCECGDKLIPIKANLLTKYWDDGGIRCDKTKCKSKSRAMNAFDTVFMCINKNNHNGRGLDLCEACAEYQKLVNEFKDSQNENKDDKQNCICGGELIAKKMKQIKVILWKRNEKKEKHINNKKHVTCNRCHKKEFDEEAIMYDCPQKGKEECHPGGYNLCTVCYSKVEKIKNLLITIYGNSPLNTVVEKGSKGGVFTHSVCQALSNNDGTIPLWKLCASMNTPLTNSSENKQIVFKEGAAATMDKLLIYPHNSGDVSYKYNVNVSIGHNDNYQIERNRKYPRNVKRVFNALQSNNKNEITHKDPQSWLDKFTETKIDDQLNYKILLLEQKIRDSNVKYHMRKHSNEKPNDNKRYCFEMYGNMQQQNDIDGYKQERVQIEKGCYIFETIHPGKAIDIKGHYNKVGAELHQMNVNLHGIDGYGNNQLFYVKPYQSNYYLIQCKNSCLYWTISKASHKNNAKVIQDTLKQGEHQQFEFLDCGNSRYQIKVRHSGQYLRVGSDQNGAKLLQLNKSQQQFHCRKVVI